MADRKPWNVEDKYRIVDAEGDEIAFCDGPASVEEDAEHAAEIVDKVNGHDELTERWEKACDKNATLTAQLAEVKAQLVTTRDMLRRMCVAIVDRRGQIQMRELEREAVVVLGNPTEAAARQADAVAARYVDVGLVLSTLRADRDDPREDDRTVDEYVDEIERKLKVAR